MIRVRRKNHYGQPRNLRHLSKLINKHQDLKKILMGVVKEGNDYALLFSDPKLLKCLNEQRELYMDGTFDVILNFKYNCTFFRY